MFGTRPKTVLGTIFLPCNLQQDVSFSTKTIFVVLNTVQTSKTPTFFCCQRSLMNCPVFRYNLHKTLKSKVKSYECDIQRKGCRGRLWVYLDGKFEIRNEHNHVPDHDKSKLVKVSALSIFLGGIVYYNATVLRYTDIF